MLRKLMLLSFVIATQFAVCAQPSQPTQNLVNCYFKFETHKVCCESQDLRCPKTHLIALHISNLIYDQEAKNGALKFAIKVCDYCATKFWLEHGAEFERISQTSIDGEGTLAYRYNPHALDHLLFGKNDKLFQIYQSPVVVGKMLCVLKPYGVKRIQVHATGKSSDVTYHGKTTTYE